MWKNKPDSSSPVWNAEVQALNTFIVTPRTHVHIWCRDIDIAAKHASVNRLKSRQVWSAKLMAEILSVYLKDF
jgi:hypothetical protein